MRFRDLGIEIGMGQSGAFNSITDVSVYASAITHSMSNTAKALFIRESPLLIRGPSPPTWSFALSVFTCSIRAALCVRYR